MIDVLSYDRWLQERRESNKAWTGTDSGNLNAELENEVVLGLISDREVR